VLVATALGRLRDVAERTDSDAHLPAVALHDREAGARTDAGAIVELAEHAEVEMKRGQATYVDGHVLRRHREDVLRRHDRAPSAQRDDVAAAVEERRGDGLVP